MPQHITDMNLNTSLRWSIGGGNLQSLQHKVNPMIPHQAGHKTAVLPRRSLSTKAVSKDANTSLASVLRLPWFKSTDIEEPLSSADEASQPAASLPSFPLPATPSSQPNTSPQSTTPPQSTASLPDSSFRQDRPILSVAGGGRFFFWYLGVLKYLLQYFDLRKCTMVGASAGGLVIVLAACDVNLDRAVREAYRLSVENDIFERPAGLAGIWGSLVREWLDELLPADAEERCSGRVKLVVTEALTLRIKYIEEFRDRDDLIDAAMASIHIPFFLDGNATRVFRGQRYVDGSLLDFFTGSNSDLINCGGQACVIDYFFDETLDFNRLDFVKLSSYDEVKALVKKGYAYAERTDAGGGFEPLMGSLRKDLFTLFLEFPGRQLGRLFAEA